MSLSAHLKKLKKEHQDLSDSVEKLQRSPAADGLEITNLKRLKLQIKDRIVAKERLLEVAPPHQRPQDVDIGSVHGRVADPIAA